MPVSRAQPQVLERGNFVADSGQDLVDFCQGALIAERQRQQGQGMDVHRLRQLGDLVQRRARALVLQAAEVGSPRNLLEIFLRQPTLEPHSAKRLAEFGGCCLETHCGPIPARIGSSRTFKDYTI